MIESLSVRAVAQRASKYSPEEDTDNVGDCLVSCEMENLSQVIILCVQASFFITGLESYNIYCEYSTEGPEQTE